MMKIVTFEVKIEVSDLMFSKFKNSLVDNVLRKLCAKFQIHIPIYRVKSRQDQLAINTFFLL